MRRFFAVSACVAYFGVSVLAGGTHLHVEPDAGHAPGMHLDHGHLEAEARAHGVRGHRHDDQPLHHHGHHGPNHGHDHSHDDHDHQSSGHSGEIILLLGDTILAIKAAARAVPDAVGALVPVGPDLQPSVTMMRAVHMDEGTAYGPPLSSSDSPRGPPA